MRSVDRSIIQKDRWGNDHLLSRVGRMLTLTENSRRAALYVNLNRGGRGRTLAVAPLVLAAHVGPRPTGFKACHENGDHRDNRLSNLRWDTQSNNILDQQRHGTCWARNKERCPLQHLLLAPNLVAAKALKGHRTCLACQRASAAAAEAARRGRTIDRKVAADAKYARIMAAQAIL